MNEMSKQEKSVMLARLCGWQIEDIGFGKSVIIPPDETSLLVGVVNLYAPANMALAKRAIEWGIENKPGYKRIVEMNSFAAWAKPAGVKVLLDELMLYAPERKTAVTRHKQ